MHTLLLIRFKSKNEYNILILLTVHECCHLNIFSDNEIK